MSIVSTVFSSENSGKNPTYVIQVQQGSLLLGEIIIETFSELAPKHCANFDSLVMSSFYDGTKFHRIDPEFMIQGGDPNSKDSSKGPETWGFGRPDQKKVSAEFNDYSHVRGTLSAARGEDINSADSQFFICVKDSEFLDGEYSAFGKVLKGMDIVDAIANAPRDEKTERPNQIVTMKIRKK
jgi:peptidyl-prolyl cis-trans isomerase B (cyclophilin B)